MRLAILKALEDKYQAQISEADATIKIYLDHSVGIGEHPQHIDEIDKQLQKIADASEKLKESAIAQLRKRSKDSIARPKAEKNILATDPRMQRI